MRYPARSIVLIATLAAFIFFPQTGLSGERRAMTLEDVMDFHHIQMHSVRINHAGDWVAYAAWPDRGDGYGTLVSADGRTEYTVSRGTNPHFSPGGRWALFTQLPPFAESEGGGAPEAQDAAVLLHTADGERLVYEDIRQARFSESGDLLFVHHAFVEDTLLSEEENEALKEAGTRLTIRDLEGGIERTLSFVDAWTADSLATTLVYTRKDTVDTGNGLYHFPLGELQADPLPLDTAGKATFGRFAWSGATSRLAYMRAAALEQDTVETAALYMWDPAGNEPVKLVGQQDVRGGYFLPYDNRINWMYDGERLFFGVRPDRFAARAPTETVYESVTDSLRQDAGVDIWHGDDPLIKTHEKEMWSQVRRQNLLSVYHLDSDRIVWLAGEEVDRLQLTRSGSHVVLSSARPYQRRITWEGWFNDIWVKNLDTGEKQLVLEEMQGSVSLSPGGGHLVYYRDKHWHVFDVLTGTHTTLTGDVATPFHSETHDRPSAVPGYSLAGWVDDGRSVLVYDRYDIWRADVVSGEMTNVTGGYGRDNNTTLRIRRLDDDPVWGSGERVFLEGFDHDTKQRAIYTTRLNGQGVDPLYDTRQNLRLRRLSGDGTTVLFTRESQDVFPDLWVSDQAFDTPRQLTSLQEQVERFNWGKASLVSYRSADGVPLQGVLIKPGDYDPEKKYPVFVYFYEKFSQRLHDFNQTVINHRPGFGYYASNGYVVFLPDVHFVEGRPGMSAVKSLVPAVQTIIDKGVADPDAVGLHGHSWSGYLAAYVVTQTDMFAAAIAGAPVSNMTSAYGGIRWGSGLARQFQYETGQSRLGASLFDRRYLYIENSPLFYAHEINTPMLIMHGDVDEAVPWEQSIELYLAMRRADRDVIFLQYRDEPHHLRKYPNKIDYTIRMKEYFDHYLRGKEAPEWIVTGKPYEGN